MRDRITYLMPGTAEYRKEAWKDAVEHCVLWHKHLTKADREFLRADLGVVLRRASTGDEWASEAAPDGSSLLRVAGLARGSAVEIDVFLAPGDAVYIPAGTYHCGAGGRASDGAAHAARG